MNQNIPPTISPMPRPGQDWKPKDNYRATYSDDRWPLWLRLLTILSLDLALWALILWAALAIAGVV